MLNEFQTELSADNTLNPKHIPYYIRWISDCYAFFRLPSTKRLSLEQIHQYISQLDASREKWQVKQAEQALRRYDYFLTKVLLDASPVQDDPASWSTILLKVRDVLRIKDLDLERGMLNRAFSRHRQACNRTRAAPLLCDAPAGDGN